MFSEQAWWAPWPQTPPAAPDDGVPRWPGTQHTRAQASPFVSSRIPPNTAHRLPSHLPEVVENGSQAPPKTKTGEAPQKHPESPTPRLTVKPANRTFRHTGKLRRFAHRESNRTNKSPKQVGRPASQVNPTPLLGQCLAMGRTNPRFISHTGRFDMDPQKKTWDPKFRGLGVFNPFSRRKRLQKGPAIALEAP